MINYFRLEIKPGHYNEAVKSVQIVVQSDGHEPIHKEQLMDIHSFESEFEWIMKRATAEIKYYVNKLKEDRAMRSLSAKEMEDLIKEKLELPNDPED